ncbi:MAG: protein phosphatase 2C domain-containing protein, partial [Halothermotrichaceae bacterium]
MEFSIYSNIGKVRDDNEDSYIVKKEPYPLIAVADGMGGHNAGEVASKLAVDSLKNTSFLLNKDSRNILDQMETAIKKTNLSIINKGNQDIEYKNMGTTLSIGIIYDGHLYIGHVGDSRVYLYRNNKCQQLTRDDSLVNKLIEDKQITSKEAFNHPQKHIITQA